MLDDLDLVTARSAFEICMLHLLVVVISMVCEDGWILRTHEVLGYLHGVWRWFFMVFKDDLLHGVWRWLHLEDS